MEDFNKVYGEQKMIKILPIKLSMLVGFLLLIIFSCNSFSNYIPNEIESINIEIINNKSNDKDIKYLALSPERANVLLRDIKSAVPVQI